MNLRRLTHRAAVAGATTALAAGALVGMTATTAQAAPTAVQYTCTVAGNQLPIFVTPTGTLPSKLTAGDSVAADTQSFTMDFTVPRVVLNGLAGYGVSKVGISTNDFAYGVGTSSIPVTGLSVPKTDVPASGDMVLPVSGKNGAYTAPDAGTYDLKMPSAFNATVTTNSSLLSSLPASCTITDPATATVGSVDVVAGPQGVAYTCTIAGNPVPVFVDPTTVPNFGSPVSGSTVPADAATLGVDFTVPAAVVTALPFDSVSVGSDDFALGLGDASIPFPALTSAQGTLVDGTDLVLPAEAGNDPFVAPAAGTYDLELPSTFTGAVTPSGGSALSGPCTIVDPASSTIGSTTVTAAPKQSSTTKATAPTSIKKGKNLKVSVTVTTTAPATGKVTAKEGSKSLASATLSGNKATITVKGLKPGKHTIKVVYAGDSTTNGSTSKAVTVTVKK